MAQDTAQEKDQSMEEILQSIKRIIAEEGEDDGGTADAAGPEVPGSTVLELGNAAAEEPSSGALPVLDLTETVDDGVVPPSRRQTEEPPQRDVLADIDSLLSEETSRSSSAALKALTDAHAPSRGARDVSRASPTFRSGGTVEDLVMEALRPMLKDWLDQHLSGIVSELVSREIKKLSS